MAYDKTIWTDRVVEFANRYKDQNEVIYTFTRDEGVITEAGTFVTAANMNKIENGIYTLDLEKAPLASPALTGIPTGPTAPVGTNTIQLATTEFTYRTTNVIRTVTKSASFTPVLTDLGFLILCSSASLINVTVPLNLDVAFPVGSQLVFARHGVGAVTFVPTLGVSILSSDSKKSINKQYEVGTLVKIGTDTWYLIGALST